MFKQIIKNRRLVSWIAVLGWILVMLTLSSDPASESKQKSKRIEQMVRPVVEHVQQKIGYDLIGKNELHFYVRKSAHVFLYFVFGFLLQFAFRSMGLKKRISGVLAWVYGTLFAAVDETFQTFFTGRSGEMRDIFIDSMGVFVGIMVFLFLRYIYQKFSRKAMTVL